MTIGVAVEGPSDFAFWNKILHKHCSPARFDIRNMKNCGALIRETPNLLDAFRSLHYSAGFILIDRDKIDKDKTRCPAGVINLFQPQIIAEARKPLAERYLYICVAVRELEAWYLADDAAMTNVLPEIDYAASEETGNENAGELIDRLWSQQYGNTAFNKLDFAKSIGSEFMPENAMLHSASFRLFWERISNKAFLDTNML